MVNLGSQSGWAEKAAVGAREREAGMMRRSAAPVPAISHGIVVEGLSLITQSQPAPLLPAQPRPALLQMNDDEFPVRFLTDLSSRTVTQGSSVTTLQSSAADLQTTPPNPLTLYQPVQRVVHVAMLRLTCESAGFPRLDPTRVDSAGLVIRRVRRKNGQDLIDDPPWAWMRSPKDGSCGWVSRSSADNRLDPDPARQQRTPSGQPALDQLLAAQAIANQQVETTTPAFVAAPAVCDAAGATVVYAVIPTASSEMSTKAPAAPQYGPEVSNLLPTLLSNSTHSPIMAGESVNYQWMSDEYARQNDSSFLTFSATLRLLYSVLGAFNGTPAALALLAELNQYNVYIAGQAMPMGDFYQSAASVLMDYDPFSGDPAQSLTMPDSWDTTDPAGILAAVQPLLVERSTTVLAPTGRFQDASRLYRVRVFLRIKGHTPNCPTQLVWSRYSEPFRIAAWHEGSGRALAPVPLPDPTDPNFRKNAKNSNCSFAVPASLMNLMQGSTLSGLSSGSGPSPNSSGGIQLNWICGFNIPLITICAFFVLNLFLILLNLVFWWLPFIKICIPFPVPVPGSTGDSDG